MEITILGTSCMVPTKERNVSSFYLKYKGEGILFDCGEGTQRQMNIAGIKRTSVTKILISHWHGDHVSGIIGLIQTIGNNEDPPNIHIYGPAETKTRINHMMETCIFDSKVDLEVHELEPKLGEVLTFYETEEYAIACAKLDHGLPCLGFSFIEKERLNIDVRKQKALGVGDGPHLRKIKAGQTITYKDKTIKPEDMTYQIEQKKLSYVADTEACEGATLIAKDADVLISECSYLADLEEKAERWKHLTTKDAAFIATQANAKRLILTHFSQRYKTVDELEKEARLHFENTQAAFDFMKINL